jgi:GNAT superfamily N-acetyltransferase
VTAETFAISALGKEDRAGFVSGREPLDRYLRSQATQDVRRRMAACFIATEIATRRIAGFYTLAAADIPVTDVSPVLTRKLPRYPTIPAARIGRLVVDQRYRGLKLGSVLLADAATRAARSDVAVLAMIVDAKDAAAEAFYRHHGFVAYASSPGELLAPLKSLLPQST